MEASQAPKKRNFIRFIKNTGIFFVGTILSKALSFFLLPIYSSLVPTNEMGVYDISVTIMTMVASVCFFEIWSGVLRKTYDEKSLEGKQEIIGGGLQVFLLSSLVFSACCIGLSYVLNYRYKLWLLFYMLAYMASNYFSFAARGLGKNKTFALSGLICSALTLGFNVFFLVFLHFDYSALYISAIIGFAFQTIFLFLSTKMYKSIKRFWVWKRGNFALIKFCLPLCLNTVAYWCLTSLNRVVFNYLYGNDMSGIFAIGARFGTIVTLITTCFNYAWQDLSFSESSDHKNNSSLYSRGCNLFLHFLLVGFTIVVPALFLIAPLIIKGGYVDSISLIPLFILSAMFSGFSGFMGSTFYAINDTKSVLITTIIGVVTNIAICYWVILWLGANGVNIATILSFLVIIIIRAVILRNKINLRISIPILLLFALLVGACCLAFNYCDWRANVALLGTGVLLAVWLVKRDILTLKKKEG